MTTTAISTEQMLRDQCGDIIKTIEGLEDFDDSFYDFINNVLEVTASGTGTVGEGWTVSTVDLLTTFGGPNIRAKIDPETSSVQVSGYWGSDSISLFGTAGDALTEWTREYAEQMEGE